MSQADAERFRSEAEKCHHMATKAISEPDKEGWLELAAEWIKLAQDAERRHSGFDR